MSEQHVNDDQVQALSTEVQQMGMAPTEVADLLSRYGPEVLSVVVQALKNGFSMPFVLELLRLFGPLALDFAISLFTAKKSFSAQSEANDPFGELNKILQNDPEVNKVLEGSQLGALTPQLVSVLVEKLLPYLVKKYGPQLLAAIIQAIEDWTKEEPEKK